MIRTTSRIIRTRRTRDDKDEKDEKNDEEDKAEDGDRTTTKAEGWTKGCRWRLDIGVAGATSKGRSRANVPTAPSTFCTTMAKRRWVCRRR